jgi:hypothetical protein
MIARKASLGEAASPPVGRIRPVANKSPNWKQEGRPNEIALSALGFLDLNESVPWGGYVFSAKGAPLCEPGGVRPRVGNAYATSAESATQNDRCPRL